jgi:glycosyltransferase involved in cell wall biosynthesis
MKKPLRVALVSHQVGRNDGQGRVNYEIARAALDDGHTVLVLAASCAPDVANHPNTVLVIFNVAKWPTQLLRNIAFARASAEWLRRNRSSADIVHATGFITWADSDVDAVHFVHGAWARNAYYPFRQWWRSFYKAYQRLFTALNAKWELGAFRRARTVVAVSNKVANELTAIGVPGNKIRVIHNGVDTDEFHPGSSERDRFNLPSGVPLFLFAGDLRTPRKNLDTVLKALQAVPALHLAVAGNLEGSPFPALAKSLGVADRVHFIGLTREMPILMRSVDAFVFPSRHESMALVLIEAMASGLPILTAQTAGGAEILAGAGRILDSPDDVERLAAWMNELVHDEGLRRVMGAEGRAIALSHTWNRMAREYLRLYDELYVERHQVDSTIQQDPAQLQAK